MNIIEFAQSINYPLFPVQVVVLKLFYQLPLSGKVQHFRVEQFEDPWGMSEASYAHCLLKEGRSNHDLIRGPARRLLWVGGRRGGRTYVFSLIMLYETWKLLQVPCPQEMLGVPPSLPLCGMVVGATREDAVLAMGYWESLLREEPFKSRRANEQQAARYFQTDRDIEDTGTWLGSQRSARASIRLMVRTRLAKGLRGNAAYAVMLDDLMYFPDASWEDTLKALEPSLLVTGGKLLVSSVGGPKESPVRELYDKWVSDPETLCIQTPTWEMNPNIPWEALQSFQKTASALDFRTEFGAELLDEAKTPVSRKVMGSLQKAAEARGVSVGALMEDILTDWALSNGERGRN